MARKILVKKLLCTLVNISAQQRLHEATFNLAYLCNSFFSCDI